MAIIHIIPNNDLKLHNDLGFKCWCSPQISIEHETYIVVHNSADGREFDEIENERRN
jgi:hypothetical protein